MEGWPAGLRLDEREVYLWWGRDAGDDHDCVATRDGRVLTYASEAECLAAARAAGWAVMGDAPDPDPDQADAEPSEVMDLEPVGLWLRGRRLWLDPVAALNLWNMADDLAYSVQMPWNTRNAAQMTCYTKLFAANVPWAMGLESYRPVWSPRQLRLLRTVLGEAVHIMRTVLPGAPVRSVPR